MRIHLCSQSGSSYRNFQIVVRRKVPEVIGGAGEVKFSFLGRGLWILLSEAREAVMEIVKDKLKEIGRREAVVRKLVVLNVLYHYFPMSVGGDQYFKPRINELGLKLEDVLGDTAGIAEGLRRKDVVSGFTTTPPYMVVYMSASSRRR